MKYTEEQKKENNGSMAVYSFDANGDLKTKYYKTVSTFAKAIINKINGL